MNFHAIVLITLVLSAGTAHASVSAATKPPDPERGGHLVRRHCDACHYHEAGVAVIKKIGPYLYGVYGRAPGTGPTNYPGAPAFRYSPEYNGMKEKGLLWTDEILMEYLTNEVRFRARYRPYGRIARTMPRCSRWLSGVEAQDARDITDIIEYLKTLR